MPRKFDELYVNYEVASFQIKENIQGKRYDGEIEGSSVTRGRPTNRQFHTIIAKEQTLLELSRLTPDLYSYRLFNYQIVIAQDLVKGYCYCYYYVLLEASSKLVKDKGLPVSINICNFSYWAFAHYLYLYLSSVIQKIV